MVAMIRRPAFVKTLLGLMAGGYLALLLANTCDFAAGPDTSGYLGHARLLAQGRISTPITPLIAAELPPAFAYLVTPYGFVQWRTTTSMVPTYPVGAPLHFATAAAVLGWEKGPFLVAPLAAVASLWLFVLVAMHFGLPRSWGVAGAAVLAAFPVLVGNALFAASDVLATFWALLAILCACKATATGARFWPVATGLAFAMGVAVRPTNVLVAIPILILLYPRMARLATIACTALPFGVALLAYNHVLFGNAVATGYGPAGGVVQFRGVPACLVPHLGRLWSTLPLVFPAGLLVAFCSGLPARLRAVLVSWFLVFLGFYAAYGYCPDVTTLRFFLPAIPALLIGSLHVLRIVVEWTALWRPFAARLVAAACLAAVLIREVTLIGRMHVLHANEWEAIFPQTVAWVDTHVPDDALVLSAIVSGALHHDGRRITLRWDQLDPRTTARLREQREFRKPWFAVVSDADGGVAHLRAKAPLPWREVGRIRDVTFWRTDP